MSATLYSNKVFQTLEYLESGEIKRLLRYLKSPYFNHSKTLVKLCELLLLQIERGKDGFSKETVWRKLFPVDSYDDVNFRKYCSDLLGLIEDFMAQEAIQQDPGRLALETLKFVSARKIGPLYNSAVQSARTALESQPYRSTAIYLKSVLLEQQYYALMDFDFKLNVHSNIETISRNLDIYYFSEKLKLYCTALSRRKISNVAYELAFTDEIVQLLETYPKEEAPELAIYYYSYKTLEDDSDVSHYFKLRALLDQYGATMPRLEAIQIFDSALHYCTGKLNQGDRVFLQEYFDLFQLALDQKIFLYKNEFSSWRFNNANGVALRLGKLDWAEHFVEQYRQYLPANERQNTYSFNLARVFLYKKQYEKVLNLLQNVEYEDIGFNLISKTMLILTYYELDEFEALLSHIEAFKVFINRQKDLAETRKLVYLNLIKYVRRLIRLRPGDKAEVQAIKSEVLAEKARIVNHEWLLEKLDEF